MFTNRCVEGPVQRLGYTYTLESVPAYVPSGWISYSRLALLGWCARVQHTRVGVTAAFRGGPNPRVHIQMGGGASGSSPSKRVRRRGRKPPGSSEPVATAVSPLAAVPLSDAGPDLWVSALESNLL